MLQAPDSVKLRTVADGRKPPPGSAAGSPRVSTSRHGFTATNGIGVVPDTRAVRPEAAPPFA
jgi:hypothetical protein